MPSTRPSDLLVDEVATQASFITDVLPGGWHQIPVPGVDRPVVLGPGGVFVLDVRHHSTMTIGPDNGRPWGHDHRNQMSTPQISAELATQLLSWACGVEVIAHPVIVLTGDDAEIVARPDGVEVIHQHLLMRWLSHLPAELDVEAIALVIEHTSPAPSMPHS